MNETENPQIIGFDLGHGESAVTATHPDEYVTEGRSARIKAPVTLNLLSKSSTVTAVAYDDRVGVIFGKEAVGRHTAREFYIAFKRRPVTGNGTTKTIKDFAGAVFQHLADMRSLEANVRIFVGCPSGWTQESIDVYRHIIAEAGLRNVMVVRESRAALMHAQESQYFSLAQLKQSVLVVDVGSSTTDFTLVRNLEDSPVDFGWDLGASLIDKAILEKTLHMDPDRARWDDFFAVMPSVRHRCELVCREAKEMYFSNPAMYEEELVNLTYRPPGVGNIFFEPKVNGPIVREILTTPMADLSGRSWPDAFRDALLEAKAQLDRAGVKLSGLLLTGGASKMGFISELCRTVFPTVELTPDNEPHLCIARGLARWGRVYVRTEAFTEEVHRFVDKELDGIVSARMPELLDSIADALVGAIVEKVVNPKMRAWRAGSIRTLNALQNDIAHRAKEWLESSAAKDCIVRCTAEFLNTLMGEVEKRTAGIRAQYGLPLGSLGGKVVRLDPHTGGFSVTLDVGDPTELTGVVTPIATTIIGVVLAVMAHVFLFTGPMGWIAGIVVWLVTFGATEAFIKDSDLPQFIRSRVTDNKIEAVGRDQRPAFRTKIVEMLSADKDLVQRISRPLQEWVKDAVREQADKARLLIA